MSTQRITSTPTDIDRFGAVIANRLSDSLNDMPHDITERLRAARMRAIANRQVSSVKVAEVATEVAYSGGAAALHQGDADPVWWHRLTSLLPLLALIIGLITIAVIQDEIRVRELAEVDAELLTDELPPSAYTDPGFTQFMRSNQPN
jgi:hypothetical protein